MGKVNALWMEEQERKWANGEISNDSDSLYQDEPELVDLGFWNCLRLTNDDLDALAKLDEAYLKAVKE